MPASSPPATGQDSCGQHQRGREHFTQKPLAGQSQQLDDGHESAEVGVVSASRLRPLVNTRSMVDANRVQQPGDLLVVSSKEQGITVRQS